MTNKKGKRAVIISNIKSSTIEQAIFILKTPSCENVITENYGLVQEAQDIINNYIATIENNNFAQAPVKKNKTRIYLGISIAILTIVSIFLKFC